MRRFQIKDEPNDAKITVDMGEQLYQQLCSAVDATGKAITKEKAIKMLVEYMMKNWTLNKEEANDAEIG